VDAEVFMDYAIARKTLNRPESTNVICLSDTPLL
jgi:hypothetical protein